jgi:sentrin-specific protease 1
MVVVDAPRQKNGFDCGVFICQYVRQLALGLPVTFSQRDIPGVRLRICSDLLDGECS